MKPKSVVANVVTAAICIAAVSVSVAGADAKGAYTAAQAERGTKTFNSSCSMCHGQSLGGGPGTPPLAGPEFMFTWQDRSAAELFDYVKANMPPSSVGSLTDQQYADVVAVILKANGTSPGEVELTADPTVQQAVRITAPADSASAPASGAH